MRRTAHTDGATQYSPPYIGFDPPKVEPPPLPASVPINDDAVRGIYIGMLRDRLEFLEERVHAMRVEQVRLRLEIAKRDQRLMGAIVLTVVAIGFRLGWELLP